MKAAQPYANPYLAGVCLGLVLLAAFVLTGQGLGALGAFANAASGLVALAAPGVAAKNNYFHSYLTAGAPWSAWIVFEILGVIAGGALSAWLAGRFALGIETGPRLGKRGRLVMAAGGGVVMGLGAVLARGCTSGQALSGGALLSVGSWAFMISLFVAGYGIAPLVRRLWQ